MKTQKVSVKASIAGSSNGEVYTTQVTLPAPPFDVPTEREIRQTVRGLGPVPASDVAFKSVRSA